jgi:hypothetical protein
MGNAHRFFVSHRLRNGYETPLMNMRLLLAFFLAAFTATAVPLFPAFADSQDIAAASRSVVRVALAATKGDSAYFVGHGSGVVVAPDKVLTNAHVVELTRQEPNIVIGVVPAEGSRSYGARVIAFSPGNDLALLQITSGSLPPATFFSGAPQDGQDVVAIGYPGNVDRAQGMNASDMTQPMTPVKTHGTVSSGRSSKQFDTILHTAPVAAGSSGGPLVDTCGRVLGLNSSVTVSDTGDDAEYAFAVSDREIASFLRQAGVQPQRTIVPCRSLADLEASDRVAAEQDRVEAERQQAAAQAAEKDKALHARQEAEQSVITSRENALALAAVLLGLAVLSAGAVGVCYTQRRIDHARYFGIAAALLFIGSAVVFALRPGFNQVDDRATQIRNAMSPAAGTTGAAGAPAEKSAVGDNLCHIDLDRSRVTVSDTSDVPLNWTETGCINGKTQLAQNGNHWSRTLVPMDEESVSVRSFDPATGTYRSDKYLLDAQTAEAVRNSRNVVKFSGCTTDPAQLEAITRMESDVRALLPSQPNERLVYHCTRAAAPPAE